MHREILGFPVGKITDHADKNRLNNQLYNLRPCDHSQNNSNKDKFKIDAQSKYKGVYKKGKRMRAEMRKNGKSIHLGYFDCERAAARMYNRFALIIQGQFASLNVIDSCDCSECCRVVVGFYDKPILKKIEPLLDKGSTLL